MPVGQSVPCQVKECVGLSGNWLPLLGAMDEAPNQTSYVRVVPLNNGEVNKDVLHVVQNELHSGRLNYVVMVHNKFVKAFESTAAVVRVEDRQILLQCVGELFPIAQDQPENVSRSRRFSK